MRHPKITIVTPNYNLGEYIEDTIMSVLDQGYPNLEYIIIDGGSTDNSIEIINKYKSHLAYWISEKDRGLYDALNKGFSRSTGDIMGWLNSDDILHRKSLFNISNIFRNNEELEWIQGYPSVVGEYGETVFLRDPICNYEYFLNKQYHSGKFIQQESTYWRRSLWNRAGGYVSTNYTLAGDFELWIRFFQYARLDSAKALIGGFRYRNTSLSSNSQLYLSQADEIMDSYTKKKNLLFWKSRVKLRNPITVRYRFSDGVFRKRK